MKRTLTVFGIAIGLFAAVLLVNAFRRRPLPRSGDRRAPGDAAQWDRPSEHLAAAIRFRTVSHEDAADDDRSELDRLHAWLEATYPKVHATLSRELVASHGLLYRWQGTDSAAKPVLVMAHQDVVPIEPGTESKWTHPPFAGVIADGFVWGRGAIDDKGSLIALFEALESLADQGFQPARTIYFASGFDEEVGGHAGASAIATLLSSRGIRLEWVLDEGSAVTQGIVPGVERPLAFVAVSEKGYLSVELVARSEGGHSSMPPAHTSVGSLAAAVTRLETHPMPLRMLPAQRDNLEAIAPEMPFLQRLTLSNMWALESLALRFMARSQRTNALVRTTTAPTILSAGVKDNVLPSEARAVVNFRILPGDTAEGVVSHVRSVIDDPSISVRMLERTISAPAPLSSTTSRGYKIIESAIHEFFPDAVIAPGLTLGATDSRYLQSVADDVYRFGPWLLRQEDLARIHGTDERCGVADLWRAIVIYKAILVAGARSN
jgi:carboxypeptidase PM20D1